MIPVYNTSNCISCIRSSIWLESCFVKIILIFCISKGSSVWFLIVDILDNLFSVLFFLFCLLLPLSFPDLVHDLSIFIFCFDFFLLRIDRSWSLFSSKCFILRNICFSIGNCSIIQFRLVQICLNILLRIKGNSFFLFSWDIFLLRNSRNLNIVNLWGIYLLLLRTLVSIPGETTTHTWRCVPEVVEILSPSLTLNDISRLGYLPFV